MAIINGSESGRRRASVRTLRTLGLLVLVPAVALLWWSAGAASGAETAAVVSGPEPVNQWWPLLWLAAGALLAAFAWIGARRAGRVQPPAR